jgi:flagellar protein FlaJ
MPDALQLIASNIKAGLTTERSLIVSARPEFGPLGIEMKNASANIMAGMPVQTALLEMSRKIKSGSFERTLWLVSRGISSGGQIADLLMQIADDLREQASIKQEVAANISMYIILIFTTSAFGAPLLFGTSTFIVEVMNAQMAGIGAADIELVSQMPSNLGFMQSIMGFGQGSQISTEFIIFFSMLCLVIVAIFSSLTIGIINTGSEKNGIRFMPVMLVVCFALFFVTREVLHLFFGGMIA